MRGPGRRGTGMYFVIPSVPVTHSLPPSLRAPAPPTCSPVPLLPPSSPCSLLRALEKGPEAKAVLDSVIDAASAMQV